MNKIVCFLTILVCVPWADARAQEKPSRARAELLTDATNFTRPFSVGIRFLIEPDWYLYWKNPGDAGLPVRAEWKLPEGWSVSPLQFPTPEKYVHESIVGYGYKKEVVFFAVVTPGSRAQPARLEASLDWLVCKESCIREQATVSLALDEHPEERRLTAGPVLHRFRQLLPANEEESSITVSGTTVSIEGRQVTVTLRLEGKGATSVVDFFPEASDELQMDYASIRVSDGKVTFSGTLTEERKRFILKGLWVTTKRAFACSIPIDLSMSY